MQTKNIFEIPQCVIERVDELKKLVTDNPVYIPIPEAAKFLRTSPASLRATLEQNPVFGLAWKKENKSNPGFKIPTPTFYFWFMNMAGVQRFYEQYL